MKFTKEKIKELVQKIQITKVLSIEKHTDADRLLVVKITNGKKEFQVVTGASNFKEGDLVPFLGVGEIVPGFFLSEGKEFKLEKKPLRGVVSEGMILAEDEIGISEDHSEIRVIRDEELVSEEKDSLIGKSILEGTNKDFYAQVFNRFQKPNISPEVKEKVDLIMSIGSEETGGEVIGEDQLADILTSGEDLYTYDGFEPSGQMHIAQGIIRAINTNKMIQAGFTFRMYVADWFGFLNNKMGGDLEKIKNVGKYFIEIWKASGMDLENTEFIWTSEVIKDPAYWETVLKISRSATLKRVLRTTEIMGRNEDDDLSAAQIIYPCMQTADIFHVMKCQVTELGMDQRKVNMLAREIGPGLGYWKPVVVSHGMLQGLQKPTTRKEIELKIGESNEKVGIETIDLGNQSRNGSLTFGIKIKGDSFSTTILNGQTISIKEIELSQDIPTTKAGLVITLIDAEAKIIKVSYFDNINEARTTMKMSKSKPDTVIFMTDSEEEVKRKIMNAFCPPEQIYENPILEYCKQILFQSHYLKRSEPLFENGEFVVKREEKFGGDVSYKSFEELETDFSNGTLYPLDLKNAVIKYLNKLIDPVRRHFNENKEARELLEKVRSYQVTR